MSSIYVFSGPCGCGKSTLTEAYARHLTVSGKSSQTYVIHGDDFHRGFIQADCPLPSGCPHFLCWSDILKFN